MFFALTVTTALTSLCPCHAAWARLTMWIVSVAMGTLVTCRTCETSLTDAVSSFKSFMSKFTVRITTADSFTSRTVALTLTTRIPLKSGHPSGSVIAFQALLTVYPSSLVLH
eukprot:TRINITY_DN29258_c0_g1_i1.p1 TRINITY_DN29258_c0_g1~~TRINITY_DN29258_c0_g1_i1.p1  ORF type:complete len:112 (+),score=11.87 TRINITY_DN29258_c0_g1_i1:135-470(+)